MNGLLARFRKDQSGTAAVEFGLVAPVLAAMLVGVTDFGLAYRQAMELDQAVHFGTQYALHHSGEFNAEAIRTAIQTEQPVAGMTVGTPVSSTGCLSESGLMATAANTLCPDGSRAGTFVTVTATAVYTPIATLVMSEPVTQIRSATIRVR